MYTIIWEYRVKAARQADFEKAYGVNGAWTALFKKARGYQGTELLHDVNDEDRYLTIDRWESQQAFKDFLVHWQNEYQMLDAECGKLTEREALLGGWESVGGATP